MATARRIQISDLFDIWLQNRAIVRKDCIQAMLTYAQSKIVDLDEESLQKSLEYIEVKFKKQWEAARRTKSIFLHRNEDWLQTCINIAIKSDCEPSTSRGRPRLNYEAASERTNRRRVNDITSSNTPEAIARAAERVKSSGFEKKFSVEQILSLYFDMDLTVHKYKILRSFVNSLHSDCFPSYHALLRAKHALIPSSITAADNFAEIKLQTILESTALSLLQISEDRIGNNSKLVLQCKWGLDGSSGHSTYKQSFENPDLTDEFLLVIAFVPLRIKNSSNEEIWTNPKPSSPLFCRPIKLIFIKENPVVVRQLVDFYSSEIDSLQTFNYQNQCVKVSLSFELNLTMVDGAVVNILSGNKGCSTCYICGATPSEMNSVDIGKRPIKEENFKYGLSTLHAWIKTFECILHISYRLPIQCWRVVGDENKIIFSENKRKIQNEFKKVLGLNVDKPRNISGTSNDGNTARRFFGNAKLSSEITRIDYNLIKNLNLILRVISSGYKINKETFSELLDKTRQIYHKNYDWYKMPVTLHKLLIHSCDIIEHFTIPIGVFSEEALEANHKNVRKARLSHCRKISRESSNRDLFVHLTLASEPKISINRKSTKKQNRYNRDIEKFVLDYPNDEDNLFDRFVSDSSSSDNESSGEDI